MFKTRSFSILVVSLSLFVACTKGPLSPEHGSATNERSQIDLSKVNQALLILQKSGFITENYLQQGDCLILEQDMRFEIEEVLKFQDRDSTHSGKNPANKQNEILQWRHPFIVSQNRVSDVKVSFISNVPSAWRSATRYAMMEWSRIPGSRIRFREVAYGQDLTIVVGAVPGPNVIALATFPDYYGRTGYRITINPAFLNNPYSENVATMVHELGHTIGMRHMNKDEPSRYYIPGTPLYEPNSIMHYSSLGAWRGFSRGDIIAAQVLYPR